MHFINFCLNPNSSMVLKTKTYFEKYILKNAKFNFGNDKLTASEMRSLRKFNKKIAYIELNSNFFIHKFLTYQNYFPVYYQSYHLLPCL